MFHFLFISQVAAEDEPLFDQTDFYLRMLYIVYKLLKIGLFDNLQTIKQL